MTFVDILDRIRDENSYRFHKGQVWSFWIYFTAVLGLALWTIMVTLLTVYVLPRLLIEWRRARKAAPPTENVEGVAAARPDTVVTKAIDLRRWTIYFGVPFFVVQFIVSVAGGLPGWTVMNFVFLLWVIILLIIMCCKRESSEPQQSGDESDPTRVQSVPPKKTIYIPSSWRCVPEEMSRPQKIHIIASACAVITCFIVIIIIVYAYAVDTYLIVDRTSGLPQLEYQPQSAAKGLQLMYSYPRFATNMRLAFYAKLLTTYCGEVFTKKLDDGDKKAVIYDDWIATYSINMTDYVPSDYMKYNTVNEWFKRRIRTELRPVEPNVDVVVSPADARLTAYANFDDAKVWVKGDEFDIPTMLGKNSNVRDSGSFNSGTIIIARLAPQDYHNFHAPVSGTITEIQSIDNTYWSVSADGARSENDAFYNTRKVVIIDAGVRLGKVAVVAIGATCVGSVKLHYNTDVALKVGDKLTKGEEMGSMEFGGSTVVVVYQANKIRVDPDLARNSRFEVETRVLTNERVGQSLLSALESKQN
jgi:phosphatidylserine decarboxylase